MPTLADNLVRWAITDGVAQLHGVMREPWRLWTVAPREAQAARNVEAARALPDGTTPIFLGVEHLPALCRVAWDRPAIVIEKSRGYAEVYRAQTKIQPGSPQVQVVIGQEGIVSPLQFRGARHHFWYEEMGGLAMRLLEIEPAWWRTIVCYPLARHAVEQDYAVYLEFTLRLTAGAQQFHAHHAPAYAAVRRQSVADIVLLLLTYAQEQSTCARDVGDFFPGLQQAYAAMPAPSLQHQSHCFAELDTAVPVDVPCLAEMVVARQAAATEALLQRLTTIRPRVVACRNLAPFWGIEALVFERELLRHCGIPLHAVFRDLLTHMHSSLQGGGSYTAHGARYPSPHTIFYAIDGYHAARTALPGMDVRYAPYRYLPSVVPVAAPAERSDAMELDVVVVHSSRVEALAVAELNELYECVADAAGSYAPTAVHHALLQTRQRLQATWLGIAPPFGTALLSACEWLYYAQHRIRMVMAIVPKLEARRVRVYGEGWDRLLPAALCGGKVAAAEVPHLYRHATVMLSLAPANSFQLPHPSVVECTAAGGLPLAMWPTFGDQPAYGHSFLDAQSVPYFRTADEAVELVNRYCGDWSARQARIHAAQTTWLPQLWDAPVATTADRPACVAIPLVLDAEFPITGDRVRDAWLLEAVLGYLYSFSGYLQAALTTWQRILHDAPWRPVPLIVRAAVTAVEAGDSGATAELLTLAQQVAPQHRLVRGLPERLRQVAQMTATRSTAPMTDDVTSEK